MDGILEEITQEMTETESRIKMIEIHDAVDARNMRFKAGSTDDDGQWYPLAYFPGTMIIPAVNIIVKDKPFADAYAAATFMVEIFQGVFASELEEGDLQRTQIEEWEKIC